MAPILSPQDFLDTVELADGYYLEPVLVDPVICEPVDLTFDGNGRMYVLEMRTYMRDADFTGEMEPTSVVSLHQDTDGDGTYETSSIFADGLVLPRKILALDDGVVIGETNTHDLYVYKDLDGDGVADEKTIWFEGGDRTGNMEHQPNGFVWGLDNWLYATYNNFRLRYTNGTVEKQAIPANQGQWGLTQDNYGKMWFVNAGGERGPVHYQAHIEYGRYGQPESKYDKAIKEVWPIDNIPDVQGGAKRLREDNTLNHYTATCGQVIYRGDRLPADLQGDLLFCEPVGRLIRRLKVTEKSGLVHLEHPYHDQQKEFIRSTDANFRAVNMKNAPDGSIYIIDMYRGIIQQGNWTRPGSYLREVIDELGLAKNINHGRIYRLRHQDFELDLTQPALLEKSAVELLTYLGHPNGWWRDQAQKLIVLKGDVSVRDDLLDMISTSQNPIERLHAYWVLEGLGALDKSIVLQALQDSSAEVQRSAMRFGEAYFNESDIENIYVAHARGADKPMMMQAMLSLKRGGSQRWEELFVEKLPTIAEDQSMAWFFEQLGKSANSLEGLADKSLENQKYYHKGREVYQMLCVECHGDDARGRSTAGGLMAPSLVQSPRVIGPAETAVQIILNGMQGPIDGETYLAGMMFPSKAQNDDWVAAVTTYIRSDFGNKSSVVNAAEVAAVRNQAQEQGALWTQESLEAHHHVMLQPDEAWVVTTSDSSPDVGHILDDSDERTFRFEVRQKRGDWLQVTMPSSRIISGIFVDAGEKDPSEFALGVEVSVSMDGQNWQPVEATRTGRTRMELRFAEVAAQHVRLTLAKGNRKKHWSVQTLRVYGQSLKP